MNVADIMSSPVYVVNTDEPVTRARKLMLRQKINDYPACWVLLRGQNLKVW